MLRAINLKGHNRIGIADLRALFADLGCTDVSTYVQSGNVVFKSPKTAPQLVGAIERAISSAFGLDVTVLVRSKQELAKVVAGNPFAARAAELAHLHVTKIGGYLGIVTALAAWYASAALVINATHRKDVLPTLPR